MGVGEIKQAQMPLYVLNLPYSSRSAGKRLFRQGWLHNIKNYSFELALEKEDRPLRLELILVKAEKYYIKVFVFTCYVSSALETTLACVRAAQTPLLG